MEAKVYNSEPITKTEYEYYDMHYCQCSICEKVREHQSRISAERDKAIARAAFMSGMCDAFRYNQISDQMLNDYLNSPEFLELSGAKSLSGLVK